MLRNFLNYFLVILLSIALAGCGGGGGGDVGGQDTLVSGIASKGPIYPGNVKVFKLNSDGSKGDQISMGGITQAKTGADGEFQFNVGPYTGAVLIEAFGEFTDEATGLTREIQEALPLRAAVSNNSSDVSVAVTPLSELAVRLSQRHNMPIAEANSLVAKQFNVDILKAMPLMPKKVTLDGASQGSKDYTAVLATISQLMQNDQQTLDDLLSRLAGELGQNGGLASQTVSDFATAAADFFSSSHNQTGMPSAPAALAEIGRTEVEVRVRLADAGSSLGGLNVDITFPRGFTPRAGSGIAKAPGLPANASFIFNLVPATSIAPGQLSLALAHSIPFETTELAIIRGTIAGAERPISEAFFVTRLEVFSWDAATIPAARVSFTTQKL